MVSSTVCRLQTILRGDFFWLLLLLLLYDLRTVISTSESSSIVTAETVQEYCMAEQFQPRCTHGDVISMTTASFGRMRVGRCITPDAFQLQKLQPDSLGCSADVLEYFDRMCSGRSACDIVIPNPDLLSYRPCSAQLTMYLEASYSCVNVVEEDRSCSIAAAVGSMTYLSRSPGMQLKGKVGDGANQCGSRLNPWVVEAQTGQQINIKLLDFGHRGQRSETDNDIAKRQNPAADVERTRGLSDHCEVQYGYVVDKSAATTGSRNTTICGGLKRDRFLYQTKGSKAEVVLSMIQAGQGNTFLLGFEAVGCSNLVPPVDAWLRRTDNEATVGCYTTRQRWHLRCDEGRWTGALGQCIDTEIREDSDVKLESVVDTENSKFIQTLSVVAVSFIGFAVCLVIMFIGIGCSRRYQRQISTLKAGQYPSMPRTQQHVGQMVNRGDHNNENTGFTSTDARHQYFILDKELTANQVVLNASA